MHRSYDVLTVDNVINEIFFYAFFLISPSELEMYDKLVIIVRDKVFHFSIRLRNHISNQILLWYEELGTSFAVRSTLLRLKGCNQVVRHR